MTRKHFSFTHQQDVLRSQCRQLLENIFPLKYAEGCRRLSSMRSDMRRCDGTSKIQRNVIARSLGL
jgi:hypothetical protein